jgi:very-short-patch-repair endonuclease
MHATTTKQFIHDSGGLAATFELYRVGHTRQSLAAAVRAGRLVRVRQGWYASRDIHPTLLAAARVGGRLTCMTGLGQQGFWMHSARQLHVAVHPNACRLRSPFDMHVRLAALASDGVRAHWRAFEGGSRLLLNPMTCLQDVAACQPIDVVAASAASVLHERPGLLGAWLELLPSLTIAQQRALGQVDGICESGTESLLWFRMRQHRLPVRRQVHVPGVGRVDFRIGQRLVVEVDGAAYHTDPERFEADRRRDALLSIRGYRVLRFSYRQVMERWEEVEAAILAAVIRGDHH